MRLPARVAEHVPREDLERFVLAVLEPGARRRLEQHVRECAGCARALGREAAAEVELAASWPLLRRPLADVVPLRPAVPLPSPRPPRAAYQAPARAPSGSMAGLAAAMMALFIGWWSDAGGIGPGAAGPRGAGLAGSTAALSSIEGNADQRLCPLPPAGSSSICGVSSTARPAPVSSSDGPAVCRMPAALMCASP